MQSNPDPNFEGILVVPIVVLAEKCFMKQARHFENPIICGKHSEQNERTTITVAQRDIIPEI